MGDWLAGDERGGLRAFGGLLFGLGMVLVMWRKSSFPDGWGDAAIFFTLAIPCVLLYGVGLAGGRAGDGGRAWSSIYLVFGVVLLPVTLFAGLVWLGATAGSSLNLAWIFLVTGVAAFAAALLARVRVGCLLGGLALLIAWLTFWDSLLDKGVVADYGTLRAVFLGAAIVLLLVAAAVAMRGSASDGAASDVATTAGIAAVAAGAVSLTALPGGLLYFVGLGGAAGDTTWLWDLYLLAVSIGLVLAGSFGSRRGPTYVGVVGLLIWVNIVGLDAGDDTPEGSLLGWPLIVLVLGVALLALSVLPALRRART
jgi:hypothetical protein